VRHHASLARAEAYIDCVGDSQPIPYEDSMPMLWQTEGGIFTLMRRPPAPGWPDHLIAYVTKCLLNGFRTSRRMRSTSCIRMAASQPILNSCSHQTGRSSETMKRHEAWRLGCRLISA
jgi:hypothetical protein